MSNIYISNYKNLEGCKRIDPEYYQEKYFNIINKLRKKNSVPLSKLVVQRKEKFKKETEIFNYIEISDIDTLTAALENSLIKSIDAPSRAQNILRENDIIISYVRPNRSAISIVTKVEDGFVGTSGLGVYTPQNIYPEYLLAYLKAKTINLLISRKATATEYPAISDEDLQTTPVLIFGDIKEKVKKIVLKSQEHIQKSKKKYIEAEKILYDITKFDPKKMTNNFSSIKLSNINQTYGNRMDPKYYCNKLDNFFNSLSNKGGLIKIKDTILKPVINGVSPKYDDKGQIVLINSEHLGKYGLNFGGTDRVLQNFYDQNLKSKISFEDVLVYATGAYFGRTNIFLEEVKAMAGLDVLIMKFNKDLCDPYYASLYLNSDIGKLISMQYFTGSAQEHLYDHHLEDYKIFIPKNKKLIERMSSLVKNSYSEKKKAFESLRNAVDLIDLKLEKI